MGAKPRLGAFLQESGSLWKTGEDDGIRDNLLAALALNRERVSRMGGW